MKNFTRAAILATALATTLAGCGGGGSNAGAPVAFATGKPAATLMTGPGVLSVIVGVGDSLTAGYQSGALIGQGGANPLFPSSSLLPAIQSTQDKGFWADLWGAAKGQPPTAAPLPLIKFPGIGSILIPLKTGGFTSIQASCGGLNASAYDRTLAASTRVDNQGSVPYDLGVPGQLLHEALYQVGPLGPCALAADPSPFGQLFQLLQGESTMFYPILGQFNGQSQVQAAASLRPTLTTVWLGNNDLLKFGLSNGAFGPTPASSIQADTQLIVSTLQSAGSQVALSNLPDVLSAPLFIPIANLSAVLQANGAPPAFAAPFAAGVAQKNNLTGNAYVTLNGLVKIAAALPTGVPPTLSTGDALTASFAAQLQALNDSYNTAIAAVAQANPNVAFVDIRTAFRQLAAGVPINPPKCCTGQLGGGLFGYDGIHPSNTGYALVANVFVNAINAKYATTIPQVNVGAIYAADPYAPK